MLYNYRIFNWCGKKIAFKENINNLNFTSVKLKYWQAICVKLL